MLRIYESRGLLNVARRGNNYRDYSQADLVRIKSIVILRGLGFSLSDIKKILSAPKSREAYPELFYIQLKAVEGKIAELNNVKKLLRTQISQIINDGIDGDLSNLIIRDAHTHDDGKRVVKLIENWDFDEMASGYTERFLADDEQYFNSIRKVGEMLRPLVFSKKVIDVGCGTCNLWVDFDKGVDLVAMDKSLPMLMAAKENIKFGKMRCEDILDPDPDSDEVFDVVVSTFMFHHIERPMQKVAFENMLNLRKPSGLIVVVDKCFADEDALQDEERTLREEGKEHDLAILRSEFPIRKDRFLSYLDDLGLSVRCEAAGEGVTVFFITSVTGTYCPKERVSTI
jgi:DNA-binding transcriptional MerR regulator